MDVIPRFGSSMSETFHLGPICYVVSFRSLTSCWGWSLLKRAIRRREEGVINMNVEIVLSSRS